MGESEQDVVVSGLAGQGVFVDTFFHKLDGKKRLTIPSAWRDVVGSPSCVIVMPGVHDPCLCAYPAREMNRRLEKLRGTSIADSRARHFARTLASRSNLLPWDGQGRIRVSDELLKFAGLQEDVVLVGAFESFELWSPEKWKERVKLNTASELGEAASYVGF